LEVPPFLCRVSPVDVFGPCPFLDRPFFLNVHVFCPTKPALSDMYSPSNRFEALNGLFYGAPKPLLCSPLSGSSPPNQFPRVFLVFPRPIGNPFFPSQSSSTSLLKGLTGGLYIPPTAQMRPPSWSPGLSTPTVEMVLSHKCPLSPQVVSPPFFLTNGRETSVSSRTKLGDCCPFPVTSFFR